MDLLRIVHIIANDCLYLLALHVERRKIATFEYTV